MLRYSRQLLKGSYTVPQKTEFTKENEKNLLFKHGGSISQSCSLVTPCPQYSYTTHI